jgi:glycosyltransferase involved in cell wall biosynthesis
LVSGNLYGGVEAMLLAHAHHHGASMTLSFGYCFEGRLSNGLRQAGADVHALGNVRVSRPWTVVRAREALRALLTRERFDWMICHSPWPLAMFGPLAAQHGVGLAFWLHDSITGRHWLERWASRTVPDLLIANSEFTAQGLDRMYPSVRNRLISHPITEPQSTASAAFREHVRRELNTPSDAVVLIQCSRLEPWKGHMQHLEALKSLKNDQGWISWIVGGPQRSHEVSYYERLKSYAASSGIADRVRFVGQRSDIPRLLAAADIHFQPNSGPEPFGLAFIEALSAGLPVLTTAIGGAKEIVDPHCGILVPPDSPQQLVKALRGLIASVELRHRLGSAGPSRARELSDPAKRMRELSEALEKRTWQAA